MSNAVRRGDVTGSPAAAASLPMNGSSLGVMAAESSTAPTRADRFCAQDAICGRNVICAQFRRRRRLLQQGGQPLQQPGQRLARGLANADRDTSGQRRGLGVDLDDDRAARQRQIG